MPGIAGLISPRPTEESRGDLEAMLASMRHEPSYTIARYHSQKLGVHVGALSHAGVFSPSTPITNARGDVALLFSGEHFTDGPSEHAESDPGKDLPSGVCSARWVIGLYEALGDAFLQRLNGWYSGVLIDLRQDRILLFNDRYGMGRIYYHDAPDAFLFASEAKALLRARPGLRALDVKSLGELMACECVLENRTLFPGVYLLPPGSAWEWSLGRPRRKSTYFDPTAWEEQTHLDGESGFHKLRETFARILPRYFRPGERVGMSLTAGLDSRLVMACVRAAPRTLPCYSYAGSHRDTLDVSIARKVAKRCGQPFSVIRLGQDFFKEFPTLAEKTVFITDGHLDVCSAHDIYFSKRAREIAPIRMTGLFGSEIVRNHTMFKASLVGHEVFAPDLVTEMRRAVHTLREQKIGNSLSFALFKEVPWRAFGKRAVEQSQLTVRTPYMDNDLVALLYQMPPASRGSNDMELRLISDFHKTLARLRTNRGVKYGENVLVSQFFQFLYFAVFKADYLYFFSPPQWLGRLDHALAPLHLERSIFGSQKFEAYRIWFRRELADYIQGILLDRKTMQRAHFNPESLKTIVAAHLGGHGSHHDAINKALTLELLHRRLIDG